MNYRHLSVGAMSACLLVLVAGCSAIKSAPHDKDDDNQSGIPYNLPRSDIKVVLQVGSGGAKPGLTVATTAAIVPDESAVYYARPELSGWVQSDNNIVLNDGLLHTIDSIDDGKAGTVLNSLAHTAVNLKKLSVGRAETAIGTSPFTTAEPYPTEGEINAILRMIGGKTFTFRPGRGIIPVPGTGGMLRTMSLLGIVPVSAPPTAGVEFKGGVYTRRLRSADVQTSVYVSLNDLRTRRMEVVNAEIIDLHNAIAQADVRIAGFRSRTPPFCAALPGELKALATTLDKLSRLSLVHEMPERLQARVSYIEAKLAKLEPAKTKCSANKEEILNAREARAVLEEKRTALWRLQLKLTAWTVANNDLFAISDNTEQLMVVDTSRDLRVPMRRAWIGRTETRLRFEQGVLTDFHQTKPAEALVAVDALVDTTQTLWDGFQEVLRVPQVVLGIEKEETLARIALTEQEIRLLRQNLNVVAINSNIQETQAQLQLLLNQAQLEQAKGSPLDFLDLLEKPDDDQDGEEKEEESSGDDGSGGSDDDSGEEDSGEETGEKSS